MNEYRSIESLRFIIKSKGKDSNDAYDKHCEVISAIIDAARKAGAEIDESFFDDSGTKVYYVDKDSDLLEVSGWLGDNKDEYPVEEKS
jgi:hypothetical protein